MKSLKIFLEDAEEAKEKQLKSLENLENKRYLSKERSKRTLEKFNKRLKSKVKELKKRKEISNFQVNQERKKSLERKNKLSRPH